MPHARLDRTQLAFYPLAERHNKVEIERDHVPADGSPPDMRPALVENVQRVACQIAAARARNRPVVLAFGAHTIKNGLAPVLIELMRTGCVQHLATNGAGIIHDWEFAFQGKTSEDVRANTAQGRFGMWQETGFHINLAIALGALDGLGYGESVGRLITEESHDVPERDALVKQIREGTGSQEDLDRAAASADLLRLLETNRIDSGRMETPHPWKGFSVQAAAFELGIPFTAHPMFGHDIIYTHPVNCGAAVGRTAERDFLAFAHTIADLTEGIYLSVGSAVMSPMIFEKSLSMAQNLAGRRGEQIHDHTIVVVDLAENRWDWQKGEPPPETPEYYLRYCKTFSRMGGRMHYVQADNRQFLPALLHALKAPSKKQ